MGDNTEVKERGCVIVANGRFPSAELPLRLLKEAKTIIACDGAVKTLYEKGIHPDAIVGDLDSIPADLRKRYADRIHHVEDQEINDLSKSIRFAHAQGYREVLILGATGLREDHTLGNISLLMEYAPLIQAGGDVIRLWSFHTYLRNNDFRFLSGATNLHFRSLSRRGD